MATSLVAAGGCQTPEQTPDASSFVDAGHDAYEISAKPFCHRSFQGIPNDNGVVPDELIEISGIVASTTSVNVDGSSEPTNASVYWVHNDSGDDARVFALGRDATKRAEVRLLEETFVDAEDIAVAPCPDGSGPCVVVADTGDNLATRTDARLVFFPEPVLDGASTTTPISPSQTWSIPLEYPDGAVDVEAIVATPDGARILLFEKVDGPTLRVFVVEAPFVNGETKTARVLVTMASPGIAVEKGRMVTAADLHPTGMALALRAYTGIWEFRHAGAEPISPRPLDEASLVALLSRTPTLVTLGPLSEPQGEALAYGLGGISLVSVSEDPTGTQGQQLHSYLCE